MKGLILAALTVAIAQALTVYDVVLDEWKFYKTNARRHFRSSDEEYSRLRAYLESKDLVAKHNERYLRGLEDYKIGLNNFADWSPFENMGNSENVTTRFMIEVSEFRQKSSRQKIILPKGVSLPESVDWAAKGAVNIVIDQRTCGCCYAIAAAATVEAQVFIKNGTLPRLSFQQIIDCSKTAGNDGCSGGTFGKTFQYLESTGLTSYDVYPYEFEEGKCRIGDKQLSEKVKRFYYMFDGDEEKLKYAVATYGPMAVAVNASPKTFQLYSGGIYADTSCTSTLVHAVVLTGYGTDPVTKKDYWLIKNSWGPWWGEKGFMKLARNKKNLCGIGTLAYVPKLD